jgi:hypothetical protein
LPHVFNFWQRSAGGENWARWGSLGAYEETAFSAVKVAESQITYKFFKVWKIK